MTVYLVGAGPGDPGLLTVRGAEVLAAADVVIYDRLSIEGLLSLAPEAAERISVAKIPGGLSTPQDEINALLVERGRAGQTVVRLKGGDPFVFARGGEEALALMAAEVPFEVVPGITSAVAVPAYAGIPVTLRHSSTSFTVVTGHEDPGHPDSVEWEAVAKVGGTIVVLMGVGRIRTIVDRLLAGGLPPETPAASVQWGTRPEQRTIRATLGTLADQPLASPSTIVIGDVAAQDLTWFESRPLFGKRVVVTRAREQASDLVRLLHAAGASTVELATIEIADPADGGVDLQAAAASISEYDWVVLTSVNGAVRFLAELPDARALGGVQVAAIGPGTAAALAARNIVADLVPEQYVAESLLEAFPSPPVGRPGRVLLPRAAVARDTLPDGLRDAGWRVDVVEAYRTVDGVPTAAERAAASTADIITFTASSTVTRYLDVKGDDPAPPFVACIGPITADTAREHGLEVDLVADEHTVPGLVAALVAHFAR
jgi:uroporphyrinogen III methyltransferase/synthase